MCGASAVSPRFDAMATNGVVAGESRPLHEEGARMLWAYVDTGDASAVACQEPVTLIDSCDCRRGARRQGAAQTWLGWSKWRPYIIACARAARIRMRTEIKRQRYWK